MIEPTPAETRQLYRDRGHMLPSDYELEQQYGDAAIGAACWARGDECFNDLERDVRGFLDAVRKSVDR